MKTRDEMKNIPEAQMTIVVDCDRIKNDSYPKERKKNVKNTVSR